MATIGASTLVHAGDVSTGATNAAGRRILFLGNSITLHPPKADIGWTNNFGMAASSQEKDYVHLLLKRFTDAAGGKTPEARIENAADFEREYATYPIATTFKELAEFKADTVILAIAENVPRLATQAEQDRFKAAVKELLVLLKGNGSPAIYVRSSFWPEGVKDGILKQVCAELGGTFVDISRLGSDPKNYARSERKFANGGVGIHPGDAGMAAIAEAIWGAVQEKGQAEQATALPFTMSITPATPKILPEYLDNIKAKGAYQDWPFPSVVIDGEFWVIQKDGSNGKVMRYKGTNIENAERQPDGCLNPTQAVWSTIARPYILGGVWYSAAEKKLYAPLHCEYSSVYGGSDLVGTKLNRQIHLATSTDKGLTWNYEGPIITRDAPGNPRPEPEYSGSLWDGGEGDFLLYADEEHGYIYIYSGHNLWPKPGHKGPKFSGCHVSRCAISDKLAPGKWRKFYNGNWSEPALGGKASYVGGGYTIYSRSLKKYLSFQGFGTLAFCSDLAKQDWSPSFRIPDGRWVSDDIWACALTDTNKTDVSRFDKTLYVYTYWHAKPGAVYRIDFDHGETPNTLGFIVNGAASPLAYTMIPTRAYGEPLYDAGDPIESRRVRKVSYESPEMSYSDGWSSQTSTVKIRTIVTGAATISEADATVKAKLSGTTNSHVAFVFTGSGIYWRAATGPDCGKADVYLDGVFQQTVDLYGDFTPYQFGFIRTGLKEGVAHTIKIVVKGEKNPRSTGTVVRHMAFEYSAESYQASDGFCSVMGKNAWYYLAWDDSAYSKLDFDAKENVWRKGGRLVVGHDFMAPDGNTRAVRQWQAPHAGKVRVEGVVSVAGGKGDGVTAAVWHNTQTNWPARVVQQGKPLACDFVAEVTKGDTLSFVVNRNGTTGTDDRALWDPVITFIAP